MDNAGYMKSLSSILDSTGVIDISPAVEWVNVVLESPRSFFAVLKSMEGADQESG